MPTRIVLEKVSQCCSETTQPEVDLNELVLGVGESVLVTVSGGCPPYTWETDTSDYSWENAVTNDTTNLLICNAISTDTNITIKDSCVTSVGTRTGPVEIRSVAATDSTSGTPYNVIFLAQALDCYYPPTREISLSGTYNITNTSVVTPGCSSTGINPIQLSTPSQQRASISLAVEMEATGFTKLGGGPVTGTGIVSVNRCGCLTDPSMAWDEASSAEYIEKGGSAEIAVVGDNFPYVWEVEGHGFSLLHSETVQPTNTLLANAYAQGVASITVYGCDGNWTEGEVVQCGCADPGDPIGEWIGNTHTAWCAYNVANDWCGIFIVPLTVVNMGYYASQADAIAARDASGVPGTNGCDYWGVPSEALVGSDAYKWDAICRYWKCPILTSPYACAPATRVSILFQWSYPAPGYSIEDIATGMECERLC